MTSQPTTATASETRMPACMRVPSISMGSIAESENMRDCGKFMPSGSFQGPEHQHAQQQLGHIGQHQADQDLADVEAGLEEGRDGAPGQAAQDAGQAHQRQNPDPVLAIEGQRDAAARDGAHDELALGADVPDIGPEPCREPDRDHHQRRGLQGEFRQALHGQQRRRRKGHRAPARGHIPCRRRAAPRPPRCRSSTAAG